MLKLFGLVHLQVDSINLIQKLDSLSIIVNNLMTVMV
jgi:hypothetical protein